MCRQRKRARRTRRDVAGWAQRGLRDVRGEQPCQQPSLRQLGGEGLPRSPKPTRRGDGSGDPSAPSPSARTPPRREPAGPAGSRQSGWKIRHGNAAWSLLCSLAGTKRRDWRVFTGFVYPKAEGCFHLGANWKDRKQRAGSRGGVFRLKFLPFPPLPPSKFFPLIRKALCKSSYSEIRGSKKDCNGGMLQSASTAISAIGWKSLLDNTNWKNKCAMCILRLPSSVRIPQNITNKYEQKSVHKFSVKNTSNWKNS